MNQNTAQEIKYTIFITSNEPWGDVWFSKHHYANELSKLGHQVYFLNAPISWKLSDLFSFSTKYTIIKENLTVVDYRNNFPLRIYPKLFLKINDFLNSWKISRIKKHNQKIIWWQFDHKRFAQVSFLKCQYIYHVVDPYMAAPNNHKIAEKAHLIVCTSPKYIEHYQQYAAKKVFIPHVVSTDEFDIEPNVVKQIKDKYHNFCVFIGTINDDVDIELFGKIANNGYKILCIGKITLSEAKKEKWDEIKSKIEYIGVVNGKNLKNYISASTICLVLYKFDLKKIVGSRSPLKILSYLAQKKNIISTIDSEIEELEGKAIFRAKNEEDLMDLIKKGMNNELIIDEKSIDNYFLSHTYPHAIQKILNSL
jgi:hypothetical protein